MRTIRRPRRAAAVALGAGLSAALALTACTPSVPGEEPADSEGGGASSSTMTILLDDTVDTLDPATTMSTGGRQVSWLVYESLLRVDPETGESAPSLAESWEFSPTSASFVIAEGHLCADGSEITAGTVARNFERWKDPETNAPLVNNFFGSAEFTVEFDDEARTVDVDMTAPMPFRGMTPSFNNFPIACDSGLEDTSVFNNGSDGTSPYKITNYVTGSSITLERRDDYAWGPEGFNVQELPKTVELRILADPNTMTNLLLGGDADAAMLQPEQLVRFDGEDAFTTAVASTSVNMMMFNERDGHATQDVEVRRALAQAIDYQEVADVQTGGLGYVPNFLRPEHTVCVDTSAIAAVMPSGGADAARSTLEGAGYALNDAGIYEKDGTPVTITLLGMEFTSATAELVTGAWRDLGIDVTFDDRGPAQAVDVLYSGTGWDVAFVGMSSTTPTGFRPFFVGPAAPEGPNFGAINNAEYAQLQGQASELTGEESCSLWIEAEASVVANVDWVPAYATDSEWVFGEGASFFADDAQIDPLTLRKQ